MAEEDEEDDDELPSVDHGPLNKGPWEKQHGAIQHIKLQTFIFVVGGGLENKFSDWLYQTEPNKNVMNWKQTICWANIFLPPELLSVRHRMGTSKQEGSF